MRAPAATPLPRSIEPMNPLRLWAEQYVHATYLRAVISVYEPWTTSLVVAELERR
ncbi:hypothetical protein DFJ69_6263 [Thermomonospora umbrina]|uniref:Uncharacterized protein n=1 Tax=Thermomonospora umbrina TaxID=111806 RepID=A0A3D9SXW2_9ACTN|nr:hypothetical protein DFJ69_6263 [Thermomonospora umbrina]